MYKFKHNHTIPQRRHVIQLLHLGFLGDASIALQILGVLTYKIKDKVMIATYT